VVPLDLTITLMIRPRTLSGVLLSVYGPKQGYPGGDYLVLQMVNGNVVFNVDNGRGDVSTTYTPPAKNQLCDGKWHTIRATKSKNVVTLAVDGVTAAPGIGEPGFATTDTIHPMYIGGIPESHPGIRTRDLYVGCLRQLRFNDENVDLSQGRTVGHVEQRYCPAK